jgi:hypothetical protein
MGRRGFRKVIDIPETSTRLHATLEGFLKEHHIHYEVEWHSEDGFRRYLVASSDLGSAQSVLPTLQQIATGEPTG